MADVDIVNSALRKIGESAITAIDDTTCSGEIAGDIYSTHRDDLLRAHNWNFATRRTQLSKTRVRPAFGYKNYFRVPSDLLRVVFVSNVADIDHPVPYRIESSDQDTTEGTFEKSNSATIDIGDFVTNGVNAGLKFTNEVDGDVSRVQIDVAKVTTSFSAVAKIYTNSSGSPGAQVGGDSDAVTLNTQGVNTFTWSASTPTLDADTDYWVIITDDTADGTGKVALRASASDSNFGSGIHDTITSVTDSLDNEFRIQIRVSAGADGKFIACDSDDIWLAYIAQITDTDLMPPDFKEALAFKMGQDLAYGVTNSNTVSNVMENRFRRAMRKARTNDGLEDFQRQFPEGSWSAVRSRGPVIDDAQIGEVND